jgi:hypothetical protein
MIKEGKLISEYKYGTKKSVGITLFILLFIYTVYFTIKTTQVYSIGVIIFAILSFIVSLLGLIGGRSGRSVKVYENYLEFPTGALTFKIKSIQYKDIKYVEKSNEKYLEMIKMYSENGVVGNIAISQMNKEDFYELLTFLQKLPQNKVLFAEVKASVKKRKITIILGVLITLIFASVFLNKIFGGGPWW